MLDDLKIILSKSNFWWCWFSLVNKEVAWLVGINWSGKSTLFKILAWEDLEFEWRVSFDTKNPLVWHMTQQITIQDQNYSIISFLKEYSWFAKIEQELSELMSNLDNPQSLEKYADMYEVFEKVWWYSLIIEQRKYSKNYDCENILWTYVLIN